jgi:hypothetical protein
MVTRIYPMRLITFLLIFISINIFSQKNDVIPWFKHDLKKFTVSVNLPGPPLEGEDIFGDHYAKYEAIESVDRTSNSTYKILALHHRGYYQKRADETFLKGFVKDWVNSNQHEILRSEFLIENGIRIMRGVNKALKKENSFSAWQVSKSGGNIFVLSITNESGDFNKDEVLDFFNSLVIQGKGEPEMYQFKDEIASVSFETPINLVYSVRSTINEDFSKERPFLIRSFLGEDKFENFTYLMVYRNNPAGIVFEDLDADFLEIQNIYEKTFKNKAKRVKRTMFKGHHAFELFFDFKSSQIQLLVVVRCNKLIVFLVEKYGIGSGFEEKKNAFFDSIEFLPLKYIPLQEHDLDENFGIAFPAQYTKIEELYYEYPFTISNSYYALDSLSSVGYSFSDYQLSPFFTTENYDSLIQAETDSLKATKNLLVYSDSLFQGSKAWYKKSFSPDSDMIIHEMVFYRGQHYLDLMVTGNSETPDSIAWNFFNSFELKNPNLLADFIRQDKSGNLWNALESRDSATLESAKTAFEEIKLKAKDLPLIYGLLENDFSYDTLTYQNVRHMLLKKLELINDDKTIPVLTSLFEKNKDNPSFQKRILDTFLKMNQKESLRTFFNYAKDFDNENKNDFSYWGSFYTLKDTLVLVKEFVPDLMNLIDHKVYSYEALDLLSLMYKDTTILMPNPVSWRDKLIEIGEQIISENELLMQDTVSYEGEIYNLRMIDEILGFFELSDKLKDFVYLQFQINDPYLKTNAIRTAFRHDLPVEDSILVNLFTSKYDGYYLMSEMENDHTFKKLPKSYYTQDIVVEGVFVYDSYYDYGEPNDFKILEKRTIKKGEKRYILHVVQFDVEDYDLPQIGICTQPENENEVNINPDYFQYGDWDIEEMTKADYIKNLIKGFVEWDPKD